MPGETLNGIEGAGAVQVIYGSSAGLNGDTPIDDQFWNQADLELSTIIPKRYDSFGTSLAAGDFDGDGFDDLAIGVPFEDVLTSTSEVEDAGAVLVLRGSAVGLKAPARVLTQDSFGIRDSVEKRDHFGWSLAAGDFGWGPEDDLAVGVPYENVGSITDAGAVNVIYGSSSGLTNRGNQLWWQNSKGVPDQAEADDRFGYSLLAADLGRTEEADLVVGVQTEDVGSAVDAGAVNVLYGFSSRGLRGTGAQFLTQNSRGLPGIAHSYDHFGTALAAANFGRTQQTDLAVGAPNEDKGSNDAGAVYVLYGWVSGIRTAGAQLWSQGSAGVQGDPETDDFFGDALAAADFGKGPRADLAIGASAEGDEGYWDGAPGAGAVNVLYGRSSGLSAIGNEWWWQDSSGYDGAVEGDNEAYDFFGSSLAAADFGKGPGADLAIGVPGEGEEHGPFSWESADGAVNVLYSDERGLRASDDQFWWQASDKLHDSAEEGDYFGQALAR